MSWKDTKKTVLLSALEPGKEEEALRYASRLLQEGCLVAFPTETVYGLGADALNPRAVERIFQVKGRPPDNPLIIHLAGLDQAEQLAAEMPERARKLAENFWPGPLTLVLPKQDRVPAITTAGLSSVALRIPSHPLALKLIRASGLPIAAPSANISGRPSPTTAAHVMEDLAGYIEAVLDGGPCAIGVESTVLSLLSRPPVLLRPGGITQEQLEETLKARVIDGTVYSPSNEEKGPLSPGLKYRHYATKAPLYLVEGQGEGQKKQLLGLYEGFVVQGRKVGMLVARESGDLFPRAVVEPLGSRDNPLSAAAQLFQALRRLDTRGVDVIVAEGLEDRDIGKAVMNRLRKAASEIIMP